MKLVLLIIITTFLLAFTSTDKKPKFIDKANMDLSILPGDDFYMYANGRWIKNNPVPASNTRWGSFLMLRDESSKRLESLLTEAAAKASSSPATQKIGDFYASGMDSLALEKLGSKPLQVDLNRIVKLSNIKGILSEISLQRSQGMSNPLFGFSITPDRKNVSRYIPHFSQGGLTLPDRDYYFKDDTRSVTIRSAYADHLLKMFELAGESAEASRLHADAVMLIETALAKAQLTRTELRDPYKTYNKFSIVDFSKTTPSINWKTVMTDLGLPAVDSVIVNNPSFFKTADILLTAIPIQHWKSYLKWNLLNDAAPHLSSKFVLQSFAFAKVLSGQREQAPRWERTSALIDRQLGDLLGQLYVSKYFKSEAKARMLDLVNNLQETFASRIKNLDWMSEETKGMALEKLYAFTRKIGYPDKWRDYSDMEIKQNDFFGNVRRASQWAYKDMISRYGQAVDRTRWSMTPPTVNAYYSPSSNEIVFPAGILQFPFFDLEADDAVNYGGIGTVIGHEIIHGFDDNGSRYAADGNLKNWWAEADDKKFRLKADMVSKQYDSFTILDTVHVNGKLTLGENLADLGGVNMAYESFTKTKQFKEGKKIDGFTPAQRFFLSFAQIWRSNTLPETAAQLILTDPHSPGVFRTNGPIVNIDAWYDAFNVQPGNKMYKAPEERIRIW